MKAIFMITSLFISVAANAGTHQVQLDFNYKNVQVVKATTSSQAPPPGQENLVDEADRFTKRNLQKLCNQNGKTILLSWCDTKAANDDMGSIYSDEVTCTAICQ